MKMYVMSAKFFDGISKKGNAMKGFFVDCVYEQNGKKQVATKFLDAAMLGGVVPEQGNVFDVSLNFNGFIESATVVPNVECVLITRSVGGGNGAAKQ